MQAKEWPEHAVEKLRFLIKDGFSARQIADRLGYTVNSVCGKAHRLKLSIGNGNNILGSQRFGRKTPLKIQDNMKEMPLTGCLWPTGDTWCGCDNAPGRPYCAEHMTLAYTGKAQIKRGEIKKLLKLR